MSHFYFHMRDLVQQRKLSSSASQHFDSTAAIFCGPNNAHKISNKKPCSALLGLEREKIRVVVYKVGVQRSVIMKV